MALGMRTTKWKTPFKTLLLKCARKPMSRRHVDHVALFDSIKKCNPRQASNLSNSSSIQTWNAAKKADTVQENGNENYSSISLQITAVFVWEKGWKNEETGKVRKGEQFSFYTQIVCLLHSIHGRSGSIKYKHRPSGDKYRLCLPVLRTYRPPLVHTTTASFKSWIQQ
jgi:hypothetical protein